MDPQTPQLLHLVFGGELVDIGGTVFRDPSKLDIVGIYPNYATALVAWRGKAQSSVDNAAMRYFIVHMHRFLDPSVPGGAAPGGAAPGGAAPGGAAPGGAKP